MSLYDKMGVFFCMLLYIICHFNFWVCGATVFLGVKQNQHLCGVWLSCVMMRKTDLLFKSLWDHWTSQYLCSEMKKTSANRISNKSSVSINTENGRRLRHEEEIYQLVEFKKSSMISENQCQDYKLDTEIVVFSKWVSNKFIKCKRVQK